MCRFKTPFASLGLARYLIYNEHQDSILALTDALDSVQMDDKSLKDAVEMGVICLPERRSV